MKTATKPAEAAVNLGVEILVPTNLIDPSPFQTRKRFDQESLNALAASLRDHGQLQNLIVRQTGHVGEGGHRYELIAGERRWRAGQIAELDTMRCLVIEADDNAARELVIIENLERENVSAIEEAAGFQQLIESGQYTQKTLAERLHRDPSFISNRIRLRSLPEEWRSQILNGELLPTQARLLVPWADRPAVLESIRKRIDNIVKPDNDAEEPLRLVDMSCDEFEEIIAAAAQSLSRTMEVARWDGPRFEITDEIRAELDIADVPEWNGKKPRAFNVELWDRLQDEAREKSGKKPLSSSDDDFSDMDEDLDTDDVEDTDSAGAVSRLNEYVLTRHMSRHVSAVLAGHIKADTTGVRTFLMVMVDDGGYAFLNWVCESQGIDSDDAHDEAVAWKALAVVNQKNVITQMATFLQERLADAEKGNLLSLEQLLLICRDMQLDPMAKWVPDAELLDLCSDDQLREMLIDNVGPEKQVRKWKRARMLKEAADNWMPGCLPILLKPKVMIEFDQKTGS